MMADGRRHYYYIKSGVENITETMTIIVERNVTVGLTSSTIILHDDEYMQCGVVLYVYRMFYFFFIFFLL